MHAKPRLNLFGGFRLLDEERKDVHVPSRKLCAIIAYVALSAEGREPRERLAGLLWSEKDTNLAGQSLRQTIRKLRLLLSRKPVAGLHISEDFIGVDPEKIEVDVAQAYEDALETGDFGERGPSCDPSGTILDGFETVDPAFDNWLVVMRSMMSDKFVAALESHLTATSPESAARAAACLVRIDQTHEGAYQVLMEHKARSGNEAGALKDYERLWNLLDEDHDIEPTLETQELVAKIKLGELAKPAAASRPSSVVAEAWRSPSIFVRNFAQGGPTTGDLFLVGGFKQELVGALIRFREWRIKDWPSDAPPTSDALVGDAPAYVLEGSYYGHANHIRVVVTLKEIRDRVFLWSEQIELDIDRWFDAQSEIVRKIAVALNIYISAERLSQINSTTVGSDLYSEWLRGQELTQRWRRDAHEEAKRLFHGLIARAPDFGRAYSSLAQVENAAPLVSPGLHRTPERRSEAITLARKAVAADPLDTRSQLCLAWALAIDGQFRLAEINFNNACSLNGNDPWTLVSAALGWGFCGRHNEAEQLSATALSLDLAPSPSHWGYRGTQKFLSGDDRACVEAIDLAEDALINLPAWRAAALAHLGDQDGARRSMRRFFDLVEGVWAIDEAPSEERVASWLMQCFPIGDRAAAERFRDGLRKAGLPAP